MIDSPKSPALAMRPISPADVDFLFAVYASTRREEVALFGWPEDQQQSFLRMQYHARKVSYDAAYPEAESSIVLRDAVPAGAMIVQRSTAELRLVDIALLAEFRNQGLGGRILSGLIDESISGKTPLRLSVLRGNPAQRLYRRLGFIEKGSDGVYIEMEREPAPKILSFKDFAAHIGTVFELRSGDGPPVPLELTEATEKNYSPKIEQFSLIFEAPPNLFFPQRLYGLEHPALGKLELFLVPIGPSAKTNKMQYEAAFSRFRSETS